MFIFRTTLYTFAWVGLRRGPASFCLTAARSFFNILPSMRDHHCCPAFALRRSSRRTGGFAYNLHVFLCARLLLPCHVPVARSRARKLPAMMVRWAGEFMACTRNGNRTGQDSRHLCTTDRTGQASLVLAAHVRFYARLSIL